MSTLKIWTNGCYDILHVGHISLFEYAKSLGHKLYVGIDSDRRVKELKGPDRPINNQDDRKKMLESIKFIDKVFIFDTPEEMCEILKYNSIDKIVIGNDYIGRKITGEDIVKEVIFFNKIDGYSTTNLLGKSA